MLLSPTWGPAAASTVVAAAGPAARMQLRSGSRGQPARPLPAATAASARRRKGEPAQASAVAAAAAAAGSGNAATDGADGDEGGPGPLFRFGVVADVQHAPVPNGASFIGTPRYYRHALIGLTRALDDWTRRGDLAFAVQLGDILDGLCPKNASGESLKSILAEFARLGPGVKTHHILGNHCLYNFRRPELNAHLGIACTDADPAAAASGASYYEILPMPESGQNRIRAVVLDGYDVSLLGWPEGHPHEVLARQTLQAKNPNYPKMPNNPAGLTSYERRYVAFNGALSARQLAWLDETLADAESKGQRVFIFTHEPILPESLADGLYAALLWNYDAVLEIIRRRRLAVAAVLSGHAHTHGAAVDAVSGVHFAVLSAVLECPPGEDAFGFVEVYADRAVLKGTGRMGSATMPFPTAEWDAAAAAKGAEGVEGDATREMATAAAKKRARL